MSVIESHQEQHPMAAIARAYDHASLALIPFTMALHKPGERESTLRIDETLRIGGVQRRLALELHTEDGKALPYAGDHKTYLALLQLSLREEEPRRELVFDRVDLFDLLEWPRHGRSYKNLEASLDRLHAVRIVLRTALVSRTGQEYGRRTHGSHLIDTYDISDARAGGRCLVKWGDLVMDAIRLGDLKSLDWDLLNALGDPITGHLYRLLDRLLLNGETRWEVGWKQLAAMVGSTANYARPARFRQLLDPHHQRLIEHGVIDQVEYQRGGVFVYHLRNYLRVQLRRVLVELDVYPRTAGELVSAYDEAVIMAQCDCLRHGLRGRPEKQGGFLVEAIRNNWDLTYGPDDREQFLAIWELFPAVDQAVYHAAALKLVGGSGTLFDGRPDPTGWSQEMRAVVRFMLTNNLQPGDLGGNGVAPRKALPAP
ncbi:MAG: replication initiator protein A [Fimbriimonadaceae bacterium]|nr:replication initiator protein A [Fimbriimonadaceae bacterium]